MGMLGDIAKGLAVAVVKTVATSTIKMAAIGARAGLEAGKGVGGAVKEGAKMGGGFLKHVAESTLKRD